MKRKRIMRSGTHVLNWSLVLGKPWEGETLHLVKEERSQKVVEGYKCLELFCGESWWLEMLWKAWQAWETLGSPHPPLLTNSLHPSNLCMCKAGRESSVREKE